MPSTGWSDPQLVPYTYVQAPPDGIYDYDFVATSSGGIATKVIRPVRFRTELPATGVKGIRVHAASNDKVAMVDSALETVENV